MLQFRQMALAAALCLGLGLISNTAGADAWPQFRGARGDGISSERELPRRWSKDQGIAWSVDLPGRANSSPAVTERRVDVTTQTPDNTLWVISIDRGTGAILRKVKVGTGRLAAKGPAKLYTHRHNAATPSPIADEDHIWAFFGSGLLVCVDAKTGKIVWQRDMVQDYGPYDITFGMGSTPRLWGDLLYVACMTKGPSYVVAFDKLTGKEVWKSKRALPAKDDGPDAYSTPVVLKVSGRDQLLVSGADHVNAYDLRTGRQQWISSGLTIDSPYGRIIASPIAAGGIVVATSGNPAGGGKGKVIAVRVAAPGDVSSSRLWTHPKSTPDSSTPIVLDGNVYLLSDMGIASCLDLESGKVHWTERLAQGPYHASLVAGDGKIYCLGIDGNCTVIRAGKQFEVLSENRLSGTFYATPAISDGTIYLRAYERLYAISGH